MTTTVIVSSGQTSAGITVSGGELLEVQHGGGVVQTVVSSGGRLLEFGHDARTVVSSGGHETVASAGVAFGATVETGGQMVVEGGIIGGLTIDGGFAYIAPRARVSQDQVITLANGGTVEIQNAFTVGKIAGLNHVGDTIELTSVTLSPFGRVRWTQEGTSGTLSFIEGKFGTIDLTLIGRFKISDFDAVDHGDGTITITDRNATANFTQAAAGMHTEAAGVAVHAGGSASPVGSTPLAAVARSRC